MDSSEGLPQGSVRPLRKRPSMAYIYKNIISLFKKDCEDLVAAFRDLQSESFQDFLPLWKSHSFYLIYEKYSKDGVLNLLKEDSLLISKNIMLNVHFLGGLFLMYGLYCIQEHPRAYIRIEQEEFQTLLENIKVERIGLIETCQPGFMVARLIDNNAFAHTRFGQEFSIENQSRFRIVQGNKIIKKITPNGKTISTKNWLNDFLNKESILDDIKKADNEYFKKKQELKSNHPELNLALDLVPDDLVADLKKAFGNRDGDDMEKDIGTLRTRLKKKQCRRQTKYWNSKKVASDNDEPEEQFKVKQNPKSISSKKKRGPFPGKRKFFIKSLVNDPEEPKEVVNEPEEPKEVVNEPEELKEEAVDSPSSDDEEIILSMPNI